MNNDVNGHRGSGKAWPGRPELKRHRNTRSENPIKKIADNIKSLSQRNRDGRRRSWL